MKTLDISRVKDFKFISSILRMKGIEQEIQRLKDEYKTQIWLSTNVSTINFSFLFNSLKGWYGYVIKGHFKAGKRCILIVNSFMEISNIL